MFKPELAQEAMVESLNREVPSHEDFALEVARDTLLEDIESGLIYYHDILELWDCSTHGNIVLSDFDDLMSAITASTAEQLLEDYDYLVYDSIDEYILENLNLHADDEQVEVDGDMTTWGQVLFGFECDGTIDRDTALTLISENVGE